MATDTWNGSASDGYTSGTASGGTLTVSNGTTSEKFALLGDYTSSKWSLTSNGHGGTNLIDPPALTVVASGGSITPTAAAGANATQPASSAAGGVSTAGQHNQAAHALLAQYATSSFAPAGGGASVMAAPQVATTPLLATPHHA